jgi:hypothetical protein
MFRRWGARVHHPHGRQALRRLLKAPLALSVGLEEPASDSMSRQICHSECSPL